MVYPERVRSVLDKHYRGAHPLETVVYNRTLAAASGTSQLSGRVYQAQDMMRLYDCDRLPRHTDGVGGHFVVLDRVECPPLTAAFFGADREQADLAVPFVDAVELLLSTLKYFANVFHGIGVSG
jgi:hypothetical protein